MLFLPERIKLEKIEKFVANLYNKTECVIHIRNLKQALNYGLILKKVHRFIKFYQKAWLKPYIDMNTKLRQQAKDNFGKDFFKLMNNAVFGKTMKNVRKHRNVKTVATERRRNYLVSEPNYHFTKLFHRKLIIEKTRETQTLMNKPFYLGSSILGLSKTVMYELWYHYVKPRYGKNSKHCYMDTDSFIVHVKTNDIYKDISQYVETGFGTLNFEIDISLPNRKNKKLIGLKKYELGEHRMKEFVGLRAKRSSYLKCNNSNEDKKPKSTIKRVIKRT